MYQNSLFIFRRSLRLDDNTGLYAALKQSKSVIPIFIFTPEQLAKNSYKSDNCAQFMIESIRDLDANLKKKGSRLFVFWGKPYEVVEKFLCLNSIDAVFVNQDYTVYARKRDRRIIQVCNRCGVDFNSYEDLLLNPIQQILSAGGMPYQKYTPYLRKAAAKTIAKPKRNSFSNYVSKTKRYKGECKKNIDSFYKKNSNVYVHGGRENGLKILKQIQKFNNYDKNRNILTYQTTLLSVYIKFGCISIRECYHAFKKVASKDLIRQLFWRDFYYNIAYNFPRIFGKPLKEKYEKIVWSNSVANFNKWKVGKTGFPIVDACMRELNATGFMHNRGRLIVSNFLVKILLIDWRKGEKYFAQKLIDYDPSVNNGNWQWSASCGADSQPYFRVFNPWIQSKKHDSEAVYIKRWLPELESVTVRDIHNWHKTYEKYKGTEYPKPMVNYTSYKEKALKSFAKIF
jgi:deoxyribodipyrimidine photo-lyase